MISLLLFLLLGQANKPATQPASEPPDLKECIHLGSCTHEQVDRIRKAFYDDEAPPEECNNVKVCMTLPASAERPPCTIITDAGDNPNKVLQIYNCNFIHGHGPDAEIDGKFTCSMHDVTVTCIQIISPAPSNFTPQPATQPVDHTRPELAGLYALADRINDELIADGSGCDITSLGGDCGYLFWEETITASPESAEEMSHDLVYRYGRGELYNYAAPPVPLAKSLAQNGWKCRTEGRYFHCTIPIK